MKKIKQLICLILLGMISMSSFAQDTIESPLDTLTRNVSILNDQVDKIKKLKVSGYFQPQFQYSDSNSISSYAGGNFNANTNNRFMLRRARVKFNYVGNLSEYVFQIDATEKGFSIKDMYAKFTDPLLKTFSITFGCQNRPFGNEIGYSSSSRESPERGRMSQIIFPGERDLGAMLSIQAPKTSKWNFLKLDAGVFNGAGSSAVDFDSKKDIIGHLTMNKSTKNEKYNLGLGVSYYNGGWRQGTNYTWDMGTLSNDLKGFVKDSTVRAGGFTKRNYIGGDLQLNLELPWGLTVLRAEYIQGVQPGTSGSSTSPATQPTSDVSNAALTTTSKFKILGGSKTGADSSYTVPVSVSNPTKTAQAVDTYNRNFNGAYFYFVQNIASTKFQVVAKYDWYNPNTKVKASDIGAKGSDGKATNLTTADLKYTTIGVGLTYKYDQNLKFVAYYDMVKNEATNLKGSSHDIPDNVFTLRMQYKF